MRSKMTLKPIAIASLLGLVSCASQNSLKESALRLQHDIRFYGQFELPSSMHEVSGAAVIKTQPLTLALVSDDASQEGLNAHYFQVTIGLEPNEKVELKTLATQSIAVPPASVDLEAVAFMSGDSSLLLSSEGAKKAQQARSELLRVALDGRVIQKYQYEAQAVAQQRPNKGFEAMAVTVDPSTKEQIVSVINEQAGTQDAQSKHLVFRQVRLIDSKALAKELRKTGYALAATPTKTELGFEPVISDLGVSEMIAVGPNRFWVLERGYFGNEAVNSFKNTAQIFEIDQTKVVDGFFAKKAILNFDSLLPALKRPPPPVKTLIDNVEALTLVNDPANQRTWLLAFTDDNFSPRQRSLMYVFLIPNSLL
jgi:hypothetical protein